MSDMASVSKPSNFVVVEGSEQAAEHVYADGTLGVLAGPFVSKIMFHRTVGFLDAENKEVRKAILQLSMATPQLIEFCQKTLAAFAHNRDELILSATNTLEAVLPGLDEKNSDPKPD